MERCIALRCAGFVALLASTGVVVGQDQSKKTEDSEDSSAETSIPPELDLSFSSVFENYIPFDETPDITWQEANKKVGEIGGWRAYLKLVQDAAKKEADNNKKGESQ